MPEWLEKILDGKKIYEIRGKPCKNVVGERIHLSPSGTSEVHGTAVLSACIGPLDEDMWAALRFGHLVPDEELPYGKSTYAWQLDNVEVLPEPDPFKRKPGAVIWQIGSA